MKITAISFHPQSKGILYLQLYETIKTEILNGHMKQGDQLPGIRTCAKMLNISKTTVENAYQQLLMEGYVINQPQVGYFIDADATHITLRKEMMQKEHVIPETTHQIDLRSSSIDVKGFDVSVWFHYLKQFLYEETAMMSYGDPQGEYVLRRALQKYGYAMRGVLCREEQIVVGANFQSLLYLICSMFEKQKTVGMEYGGFPLAEQVFKDCGFQIVYLRHNENGILMDDLKRHDIGILYINSASCGTKKKALSAHLRKQILDYAKTKQILILEDDHNGELRYQSRLSLAMQGFDHQDTLIYMRSFSKLLLPSIRISYMVLTQHYTQIYRAKKHCYHPSASKMEQLAFAHYLMDAHMEKQIRRLKRRYEQKSTLMMQCIEKEMPHKKYLLDESALQILLEVDQKYLDSYIAAAEKKDILIQKHPLGMLALSFAAASEDEIHEAIHQLTEIMHCVEMNS